MGGITPCIRILFFGHISFGYLPGEGPPNNHFPLLGCAFIKSKYPVGSQPGGAAGATNVTAE